ncbi:hypothetical protein A8924_4540 [Saccharopolyspora erythraea NRRL 2338]|uniref:Secreted protein n=2 Tax=Saccharopolyspora erythraea TaxID=1836 RepID=A4FH91_SACEN|nr:hypothetical protein [Saccharopolyspora erythraea]AAQ94240.1 unknown [Saccharopolyspora erythraea]EQD86830.1 hypothetical protein N599_07230 [Saccharopolyspora erythraea D]PFG97116.1 hypothetical protein A8924_4540 [Saccharopolyspora erythraea NRRL 2338]QRK87322.1 hypothetical protein JQX30_21155 [Saccharopolyspora erythraea]CAM03416.1 secreted protein [Saccharopolyspora erythraea NRRL 2338]
MNTAARLSAYGAALALVFGGAWAAGAALGQSPGNAAQEPHGHTAEDALAGHFGPEHPDDGHGHGGEEHSHGAEPVPAGLPSTNGGYTLSPTTTTLPRGIVSEFSFRITAPSGKAVTGFKVEHDKRMHLVLVRRDTTGYQHLHPEMSPDGTWRVPMRIDTAGTYRVFADFVPAGGTAQTLGVDLSVPGEFTPAAHAPSRVAEVDGYQVRLEGDLVAGRSAPLTAEVTRGGLPVTDLQPYLAAYGHLVALRAADLAYLHVHPEGEPGDGNTPAGPRITFDAEAPSAGTYRLFLDFQHSGEVRTAEFTVDALPETTGTAGN